MFWTLVEKELKAVILGPKFVATFAVCSALILLSVFVGLREHRAAVERHDAAARLSEQEMREQSSWMAVGTEVYREPDVLHVFAAGTDYDVGRLSAVNAYRPIKLRNSVYSDDPIFAVFRFIDFSFIVLVVLSLFAVLFSYDAINGEREAGTLKLVFANAVPRAKYLLAKLTGTWLALVVPLMVPILLGVLIVVLAGIPLDRGDWGALGLLGALSLLYFSFFVVLGVLASAMTRHSSVSFLVSLVAWVLFVLVVPRTSVMLAGQLRPVPSAAEIDGQIEGFSKQRWARHLDELEDRMRARRQAMAGMTPEERQAYEDDNMWNWMEEGDAERKQVQRDIDDFTQKLREQQRNRTTAQEALALGLARSSPASVFQVAAMNVAGTDHAMKRRYEDAMQAYRTAFTDYIEKKQSESGGGGHGVEISWDSDSGFQMDIGRESAQLDLTDLPRFEAPRRRLGELAAATLPDLGLLAGYGLLAFAGAFLAFLRYDVR